MVCRGAARRPAPSVGQSSRGAPGAARPTLLLARKTCSGVSFSHPMGTPPRRRRRRPARRSSSPCETPSCTPSLTQSALCCPGPSWTTGCWLRSSSPLRRSSAALSTGTERIQPSSYVRAAAPTILFFCVFACCFNFPTHGSPPTPARPLRRPHRRHARLRARRLCRPSAAPPHRSLPRLRSASRRRRRLPRGCSPLRGSPRPLALSSDCRRPRRGGSRAARLGDRLGNSPGSSRCGGRDFRSGRRRR